MSERIQKFLSGLGYGSRREVEEWIIEERLVVNGEPATVGQKISETDAVKLDGKRLSLKAGNEPMRVLLYKKRTGEMVTRDDPEGRRTVFRKLPELETGRWIAVGRLDVNTSGLLLMTNHGELARRLMHPSFEQKREYAVRALGDVSDDTFANLRNGVMLEDGEASFESIRFGDNEVDDDESEGEGGKSHANKWFIVTITEGRHREVRRLFESQGLTVNRLIRTAYGPITLGGGIKSGSFREANAEELRKLIDAVNLDTKELLPERVRESHRTKSDYSLNKPQPEGSEAPAAPVKRGDSKTATRAAARIKRDSRRENDGARWVKASKDERKLVERAERRGGSNNDESTYVVKPARAASDSPWGKTRIAAVESLEKSSSGGGDAAPQQHKARGFGASSERSYSERGDRAPATPTRSYQRDAGGGDSRSAGPYGARKPYGDKPAFGGERKSYGDRPVRDDAGARPRSVRPDKPSVSKPYVRKDGAKPAYAARDGERPAFKPRSEVAGERKPYGDRPRRDDSTAAFKPRFGNAAGDGARPAYKPRAAAGAERPRFGGGERKTYGAKPAPRSANPTQRFVVKDGAATRPGKPKIGLGKKKDETDD